MTYNDLLKYIDNKSVATPTTFERNVLLKRAIKKQIPKKVNISLKGTTGWNTKCHCPNCHSMVSHGKYCFNCGQALDFNSNGSDIK